MAETGDPLVFARRGRVRGPSARSNSWWGRAWVRSFEETVLEASDLVTARALARAGRLGAVMVISGMASAVLDPGSPTAVIAQVRVRRLDGPAWSAFDAELAREAGHLAALESGELPADLVEHADDAGVEIVPGPGDLDTACECDSWAQPCLHALALLYQLAWLMDSNPYVLLLLRGRTREQLQDPGAVLPAEADEAAARAATILALAEDAPTGHGLADTAVAAYDDEVSRLL
ncbi:MAG: zinc finger domain protein [Marmoricola sp.]|nr:zinc finger domain protein [Marmoricola sp.]